ncbi:MAG TPA: cobaltochelatase subunit CobN, partial [Polyangiales bacterium]|nr:cobaltochelatase subunit CobN [Polyangiales bacterium]
PEYPSLRLASLLALRSNASIDLYVERVLSSTRLVVVALMGGQAYWPYGVEQLVERARDGAFELVLVPGDDSIDPELERLSTVGPVDGRRVWRYLREGGPANARALLQFIAARWFGRGDMPSAPQPLARVAVYHPQAARGALARWQSEWQPSAAVVALLFYRAHLQAGNLAAFDALIQQLLQAGHNPLPISIASLKERACRATVEALLQRTAAALVLNTTGFAIASPSSDDTTSSFGARSREGALGLDRPILQVIMSGGNAEDWRAEQTGLSPRDLAMSVVLPEIDGRIITRAVSFKGLARRSARAEIDVAEYHVEHERAEFVVALASNWIRLARTPARARRIALVLANYPTRDGRLGNGVGLDTPASTIEILRALERADYSVADIPRDGNALMTLLQAQVTNDLELNDGRISHQSLSRDDYATFFHGLPSALQVSIEQRWGPVERDPRVRRGRIMVSGVRFGETFVGIQPARGYEIDVSATYHDPDLVPPHGYLAFYAWLRRVYGVHAIVHVGKHGSLEWLPGKSVALGAECWPDAVFGPLPHLYPFIVNDPGEGTQAKRRSQAVIIDHLVPPLTRAETYGPLRDLEKLVDEYYQALALDPPRAQLLRRDILATARAAQLHRELGFAHPQRASVDEDDRLLVSIDAYLCELKESQIRDGLHVFGRSPEGEQRLDTLLALSRLPTRNGVAANSGMLRSLADALFESNAFDPLDADFAAAWSGPKPALLAEVSTDDWRTNGDTRERLELLARAILADEIAPPEACTSVVARIMDEVAPALDRSGANELAGLLCGLEGRFVEPGPSGAP